MSIGLRRQSPLLFRWAAPVSQLAIAGGFLFSAAVEVFFGYSARDALERVGFSTDPCRVRRPGAPAVVRASGRSRSTHIGSAPTAMQS